MIASAMLLAKGVDHFRGDDEDHRVLWKIFTLRVRGRDNPKTLRPALDIISRNHQTPWLLNMLFPWICGESSELCESQVMMP